MQDNELELSSVRQWVHFEGVCVCFKKKKVRKKMKKKNEEKSEERREMCVVKCFWPWLTCCDHWRKTQEYACACYVGENCQNAFESELVWQWLLDS